VADDPLDAAVEVGRDDEVGANKVGPEGAVGGIIKPIVFILIIH
jgi:hypothetical protein